MSSASGRDTEEIGLGTGGGESKAHALAVSITRAAIFNSRRRNVRKLGFRQIARLRDSVADAEHQPKGGGVQDEANLIGERRTARRSVGGKLPLMELDEVLRLSARAIEAS
ncbi:hypothetical protein SS37A_37130 (plasmid) [Methylocystis iwaonis]|uniref:Uncharacterized protein n=1 Tax=Methylocystis iwaonis TaxID=2885079 RepID=A0ABN6VKA0_9HYPH|nr:hypothetical protein SS37A_37130 [Methylocystis iwaonis]